MRRKGLLRAGFGPGWLKGAALVGCVAGVTPTVFAKTAAKPAAHPLAAPVAPVTFALSHSA